MFDDNSPTNRRFYIPTCLNNHVSITANQYLQEICQPLFEYYPVSFFDYTRNYYDNSHVYLSTNPEITQLMFNEGYYRDALLFQHPDQFVHEYVIWDILDTSKYTWSTFSNTLKEKFQLTHFLNIAIKNKSYTELFCFAGNPEKKELNDIYFSQEKVFRHFVMYFRERAEILLQQADKDRLYFPYAGKIISPEDNDTLQEKLFFEKTKLKKIFLIGDFSHIQLTLREISCIAPLLKGSSYKEIAKQLNISPRTVEDRVDTLRNKFNCHKKQDLVAILSHEDIKKALSFFVTPRQL